MVQLDIGTWHLIALNSNCSIVSCKARSPQETWLANDLATHANPCTLAYWHHPRFASGNGRVVLSNQVLPFWRDLYQTHADLVLDGHKHFYERFTKLDPLGNIDANGIREIIVGTGGKSHGAITAIRTGSEARDTRHFGVLELTLRPSGYDWQFVADDGSVLDAGTDSCVV